MIKSCFGVCDVSEDTEVESIKFNMLGGCEGFGLYCADNNCFENLAVNCDLPVCQDSSRLEIRSEKFEAGVSNSESFVEVRL